MTPGWRTSEWWLSLAAVLLSAIYASGLPDDSVYMRIAGILGTVLAAMGYSVSRGKAKSAPQVP